MRSRVATKNHKKETKIPNCQSYCHLGNCKAIIRDLFLQIPLLNKEGLGVVFNRRRGGSVADGVVHAKHLSPFNIHQPLNILNPTYTINNTIMPRMQNSFKNTCLHEKMEAGIFYMLIK